MSIRNIFKNIFKSNGGFGWGKFAGFIFAVLIPGGLVAYCNHLVFPESSYIAIGMVIVSIGIAGIFTVASSFATAKVRRYILAAHLALCIVLSANLAAHWVLSRQVSGAKQAKAERHEEEDRVDKRRREQVEENLRLMAEHRALVQADAKRFNAEAWRNNTARRLGLPAPRGARPASASEAPALPSLDVPRAADTKPRLTVEQVMEKWSERLLWFAIADLLASVVAFGVCALLWEWRRPSDYIVQPLPQSWQTPPPPIPPAQVQAPTQPNLSRRALRSVRTDAHTLNGLAGFRANGKASAHFEWSRFGRRERPRCVAFERIRAAADQ